MQYRALLKQHVNEWPSIVYDWSDDISSDLTGRKYFCDFLLFLESCWKTVRLDCSELSLPPAAAADLVLFPSEAQLMSNEPIGQLCEWRSLEAAEGGEQREQ